MKATIKKPSTLFEFLCEQYPDSPRTRIKKILQSGTIRINDEPATLHSYPLKPGDIVEISQHTGTKVKGTLPFPVLYEDEHIIVVDKPAGIPTSSTDGSRNVQEIISGALADQTKGKMRSYVVHRLDKEVSGVLLFSKSYDAMNTLKDNWQKTEKHYYAVTEGVPAREEGTVKSWLIEDKFQKVHSTHERADAKFAVTHYKVIKKIDRYTLLDVSIDTGRKNQIRVHLSDLGCPIAGDRKYGASAKYKRRVRLHAYSLSFPHPVSGKMITVESPMPKGFMVVQERDERYK